MRTFWRFVFVVFQTPYFCFSVLGVLAQSKAACVCLFLLIIWNIHFTHSCIRVGLKKNHIVWEMGRQPSKDKSCWLENASWLLKAIAFSALQPSLRVRMEGGRGGKRDERVLGGGEDGRGSEADRGWVCPITPGSKTHAARRLAQASPRGRQCVISTRLDCPLPIWY